MRHDDLGIVVITQGADVIIDVPYFLPPCLKANWTKDHAKFTAANGKNGTIVEANFSDMDNAWIATVVTSNDFGGKRKNILPAYWLKATKNYRYDGGSTWAKNLNIIQQNDGTGNGSGSDSDSASEISCISTGNRIMCLDAISDDKYDNIVPKIGQLDGRFSDDSANDYKYDNVDDNALMQEEDSSESVAEHQFESKRRKLKVDKLLVPESLIEPISKLIELVNSTNIEDNKQQIIVQCDSIKNLCQTENILLTTIDDAGKDAIDKASKIQQQYNNDGFNEIVSHQ